MDSFGGDAVKEKLMNQVKQEAAMTNARQLIEVSLLLSSQSPSSPQIVLTFY